MSRCAVAFTLALAAAQVVGCGDHFPNTPAGEVAEAMSNSCEQNGDGFLVTIRPHPSDYLLNIPAERRDLGVPFLRRISKAAEVRSVACQSASGDLSEVIVFVGFDQARQAQNAVRFLPSDVRACYLRQDNALILDEDERSLDRLCEEVDGFFKSGALGTPQLTKGRGCFLPNELVVADQTSEWGVFTPLGWITICAGTVPGRPSSGVIFVARAPGSNALIKVPGSGGITLTEAPESRTASLTASKRGTLRFTSENGISGTLHLKDDTITLDE